MVNETCNLYKLAIASEEWVTKEHQFDKANSITSYVITVITPISVLMVHWMMRPINHMSGYVEGSMGSQYFFFIS